MSTRETEAQVYPAISNFQTVFTPSGARCDVLYLIKMRTSLCHVLFLPDACVRLGPALLLPPGDAGDTFFWSQPLHIGTYVLSSLWGRCSIPRQVLTSLSAKDTITWYSLIW